MSQHRTRAAAARENRLPANDDELDDDEIEIVPGSRAVSSDTSVIGAGNSVPNQETSPSRKSRVGPHEPSGVNVSSTDKPPSRQDTDGRRRRDAPSSQAAVDADRAIASEDRSSVAARSRGAAAESPSASRTPSGKNSVKGKTSAGASSGVGVDEYAKRYSGGSGGMMSSSSGGAELSGLESDPENSGFSGDEDLFEDDRKDQDILDIDGAGEEVGLDTMRTDPGDGAGKTKEEGKEGDLECQTKDQGGGRPGRSRGRAGNASASSTEAGGEERLGEERQGTQVSSLTRNL